MKKYIKPITKEINLDPQSLLAGSATFSDGSDSVPFNGGDAGKGALGKEFDGSDDWSSADEEE